jgi:hypothetical protein
MTNTTDTTDLRALMDTGTAIAATARVLGDLEGMAEADAVEHDWNSATVRGGLLLALEQLGARVESLGHAALARVNATA